MRSCQSALREADLRYNYAMDIIWFVAHVLNDLAPYYSPVYIVAVREGAALKEFETTLMYRCWF